jgi:hypothetical protein
MAKSLASRIAASLATFLATTFATILLIINYLARIFIGIFVAERLLEKFRVALFRLLNSFFTFFSVSEASFLALYFTYNFLIMTPP